MDNSIALDTDNESAPEQLSEYELMERAFEALAAEKGLVPGSAYWQLERRDYYFERYVPLGLVELASGPRPPWADPDFDFVSNYGDGDLVASHPWLIHLQRHPGQLVGGARCTAVARLSIVQKASEVDPFVIVDRAAVQEGDEKFSRVDGSTYRLTLDEAAELAHLLLLVIDVARGTSDDSAVA